MIILSIETSGTSCSAALIKESVLASRYTDSSQNHSASLPVYVDELLTLARNKAWHIDAIAVSEGPGSYTGLRIGVSTAKGLAYGMNIPLVGVNTLQLLAAIAQQKIKEENIWFCPMIDARRMEVYTCLYNNLLQPQTEVQAMVLNSQSLDTVLSQHPLCIIGSGAHKCSTVITHPNAIYLPYIEPDAKYMYSLAEDKLLAGQKADIAYFEPFYLKEFQAAPSHIKGLV